MSFSKSKVKAMATTGLMLAMLVASSALIRAANPFESETASVPRTKIDELIYGKLAALGLEPAPVCSDAVFVRRAYLDVIGTLPTGYEAQEFIKDPSANKRRVLIDRLMAREEFADYWALKWSDLLRVKAEFPINLWPNAVQTYHRWIRTSIKENKSYDRFVRELLTSNGSNFRVPPVNFYRAMQNKTPEGIAEAAALTFLGERVEKWPRERWQGLAGFFAAVGYKSTSEWKEEIIYFDISGLTNDLVKLAAFPDGRRVKLSAEKDPREMFADWLLNPKNPWFARNAVNRAWSWLIGRGIVHEPDDFRPDNPPVNPELLAYLEKEFVDSGYDFKHLFRLILNSRVWQHSSIARSDKPEAEANFAHYPLRRVEAEVLIDSLNQITGSTEKYSSPIPEPFTYIPEKQRAIALPDASITSTFLEMFGRSPRDTGLESERNTRPSAAQRLHLLNSSHIQRKIEQSRMIEFQTQGEKTPREIATGMYLGILSRYPTDQEIKTIEAYLGAERTSTRETAVDLAWALINSAEFLYRH